jgi:hypothetical protein
MERETHLQGIFTRLLISLFIWKAPRSPPSRSPSWNPAWREMPHSYSPPPFIIQNPWYMSLPPDYRFPSDVKGPLWRQMPVSRAFLNISSWVPNTLSHVHDGRKVNYYRWLIQACMYRNCWYNCCLLPTNRDFYVLLLGNKNGTLL